MIKVGVIGCGNRAIGAHIPLFKLFKDVTIAAICDKNKTATDLALQRIGYDVKTYYNGEDDYKNMLKNEKLDFVVVVTPLAMACQNGYRSNEQRYCGRCGSTNCDNIG